VITGLGLTFMIGAFGLTALLPRSAAFPRLWCFSLCWAAGLMICGYIGFWVLVAAGEFSPPAVLAVTLAVFLALWFISIVKFRRGDLFMPTGPWFSRTMASAALIWIAGGAALYFVCESHPFGEWDAWAIWNLKAKFILYGKENWRWIFNRVSWHTHPDYPLALPLINSWIALLDGQKLFPTPQGVAWLLSTLTGVTLYAGLSATASRPAAFCASALIFTHPYYAFLATCQYADILLAFFLLCAGILAVMVLQKPSAWLSFLTGLFTGQLSFIKNEGLIMMLLLGVLLGLFLSAGYKRAARRAVFFLGLGILITFSQTACLKLFLAPASGDIINSLSGGPAAVDLAARFETLKGALAGELLHKRWVYLWVLLAALFAAGGKNWARRENILPGLFLLIYFLVIIGVYLFTQPAVDVGWWIDYSFSRICLGILPLAIFSAFYLHWGRPADAAPQTGASVET
jgi:hypothetical protein